MLAPTTPEDAALSALALAGSWFPRPEDWSPWQPLSADAALPAGPGVYRLRCRDGARVQPIPRADGMDGTGVLCIGAAESSLRGTLYAFRRCAADPRAEGHAGGWIYANCGYDRRFPLAELEVSYLEVRDASAASAIEAAVLRVYVDQFLDFPPLNLRLPTGAGTAGAAPPPEAPKRDRPRLPESKTQESAAAGGWVPPSGARPRPPAEDVENTPPPAPPLPTESRPASWTAPARRAGGRPSSPQPSAAEAEPHVPFEPIVEGDWKEYIVCARCGRVMGGAPDRPRPNDWTDWGGTDEDACCAECGAIGEPHLYHCHEMIEGLRAAGYPDPENNPGLPPWDNREGFGRWTIPPVLRRILLISRE